MHRPRSFLTALVVLAACNWADRSVAQDEQTLQTLDRRLLVFFRDLTERGAPQRSFEDLLAGGPLEQNADIERLAERVAQFDEKYGLFIEAERVAEMAVGKDLLVLTYLYKAQRFPVVWQFTFYRAPDPAGDQRDWQVIALRFDTRLKLLGIPGE